MGQITGPHPGRPTLFDRFGAHIDGDINVFALHMPGNGGLFIAFARSPIFGDFYSTNPNGQFIGIDLA